MIEQLSLDDLDACLALAQDRGRPPERRGLDTEVNGVDRKIDGYAAAPPNPHDTVIGPVVAASVADARALIADVAAAVDGPVRLDLHDPVAGAARLGGGARAGGGRAAGAAR